MGGRVHKWREAAGEVGEQFVPQTRVYMSVRKFTGLKYLGLRDVCV